LATRAEFPIHREATCSGYSPASSVFLLPRRLWNSLGHGPIPARCRIRMNCVRAFSPRILAITHVAPSSAASKASARYGRSPAHVGRRPTRRRDPGITVDGGADDAKRRNTKGLDNPHGAHLRMRATSYVLFPSVAAYVKMHAYVVEKRIGPQRLPSVLVLGPAEEERSCFLSPRPTLSAAEMGARVRFCSAAP